MMSIYQYIQSDCLTIDSLQIEKMCCDIDSEKRADTTTTWYSSRMISWESTTSTISTIEDLIKYSSLSPISVSLSPPPYQPITTPISTTISSIVKYPIYCFYASIV